jgi:2-oxoglutarate ferredoxin oxidoreductase subunit delta
MPVKFKAVTTKNGKAYFHNFPDLCKGCGLCIEKCPVDTIGWSEHLGVYGTPTVEPGHGKDCIACMMCQLVCPDCAILIEKIDNKKKA